MGSIESPLHPAARQVQMPRICVRRLKSWEDKNKDENMRANNGDPHQLWGLHSKV